MSNSRVSTTVLAACGAVGLLAAGSSVATGHLAPDRAILWGLLAAWGLFIRHGLRSARARRAPRPRGSEGGGRATPTARADDSTAGRLLRRKWDLDHALAVRSALRQPRAGRGKPAPVLKGEATLDVLIRCKRGRDGGGHAGEPALWDRDIDGREIANSNVHGLNPARDRGSR